MFLWVKIASPTRLNDCDTNPLLQSCHVGQDALRKGRISLPGHYYHVISKTLDDIALFTSIETCRPVAHALASLASEQLIQNIAWVLMPNHFHWLLKLGESLTLSQVVGRFKGRASHDLNIVLHRSDPVWERAFFDRALRKDEDVRRVAEYIVSNPVRAGLVNDIGQFPYWDACWLE